MPDEEEKGKGFKVQDRRRFNPEGEAREDVPEREERPAAASQPRQTATAQQGQAASQPEHLEGMPDAGEQAHARDAYARASGLGGEQTQPEDVTFGGFVLGLSTEALALLGEIAHPATGERLRDLNGAQQIIDILAVLRERTRGNLSRDEENLMDAVLFDLRMKYVEIARQVR